MLVSFVAAGAKYLAEGDGARGALSVILGLCLGSALILWSRFAAEDIAEDTAQNVRAEDGEGRSDWRNWLSDFLIIGGLSAALALELYLYGTSEPWAIALIAAFLLPFAFVQYANLSRLTVHPSLWRFLLRALGRLRFSFPLAAGAAAALAIGEPKALPSMAFFEAAAQLIPLLALVLAVEGRAYAFGRSESPGRLALVLYTFAAMGIGELFCLRALAFQKVGDHDFALVSGVLVTTFISILFLALLGPVEVKNDASETKDATGPG
jgi:hypothetical protein